MATKNARKSSTQTKGSTNARTGGPNVDKPSSVADACMSDLLKKNFLSSPFTCAKLETDWKEPQHGECMRLITTLIFSCGS
ncbi:PREDICTED: LOC110760952 partial [Prunus dulcis]|uniref:PREDICTED: LOC110760952 partial n=1 Tax=Prunus dulcis TaxID=3755 RepID=A0A5E4G8N8_PRUDU|nr:hypothetical protein L3X38_032664 [Prunus dulcis]VVA36033.1 PREDICTED: LOC110760952 partial [Prunus dulcis]